MEIPTPGAMIPALTLGQAFLERVVHAIGRQQVVVLVPPVLNHGTWVEDEEVIKASEQYSEALKKMVQEKQIRFADLSALKVPTVFDGVHLSEAGHAIVAQAVVDVVNNIERDI